MEQIDFVIPWVDGNDPAWQQEKEFFLRRESQGQVRMIDATTERYRDWDILRYWFRAVERYAPWVHQVCFVTCGQVPEWLNLEAPKLRLIRHSDYIPERFLPTFSSHPIELNLHRIQGLSERFVYFNDDFFLTAPVAPEDFFDGGLPCDCIEERPIEFCSRDIYNHIQVNDIIFANRHFNRLENRKRNWQLWYSMKTPHITMRNLLLGGLRCRSFFGLHTHHLPQAYLKQTLEEVWSAEPDWLEETCSHRFRNQEDLSQFALKFWQLLSGHFSPYNKRAFGKVFCVGTELDEIVRAITTGQYRAICLNDGGDVADFDACQKRLAGAFECVLPEKSSFER